MQSSNVRKLFAIGALAAFVGLVVAWNPTASNVEAADEPGSPNPANKMAVAGSSFKWMTEGGKVEVVLFQESLKTSKPTDLLFNVNAECALWTKLNVLGNNQENKAIGRVKVWVEFDGAVVPVSQDDTEDTGKVVFCDRVYSMRLDSADGEDDRIETYLDTRSANSFTWILTNAGSATHSVVVKAELDAEATDGSSASAGVGKRTLTVSPEKFANDEQI